MNQTAKTEVAPTAPPATAPNITSFAPETPVYDDEGAARAFNVTVNQTVNVTWLINGTQVGFNASVTGANYTNASAVIGTWNVSAIADNTTTGLADMQTWDWIVTAPAPGSDLVGLWHMDEGTGEIAVDSSGNGNNGTIHGAIWTTGKNGSALQFDGIDGYVDCGSNSVLDITDAITVMVWVKQDDVGEGGPNAGPVCKAEAGVDWSWQLRYNAPGGGNYMGFQFNGDPEGATWASVKQNLSIGEWYHIAGTFNGTDIKCYLNGVEKDTNQISAIRSGNSTLFIGQDGWDNIFDGTVDEVKIYNRALTAEEIKADYNVGSVFGTITYASNETGIAGVTVNLTQDETLINSTVTDTNGNYTFTAIPQGIYNVTASKTRF